MEDFETVMNDLTYAAEYYSDKNPVDILLDEDFVCDERVSERLRSHELVRYIEVQTVNLINKDPHAWLRYHLHHYKGVLYSCDAMVLIGWYRKNYKGFTTPLEHIFGREIKLYKNEHSIFISDWELANDFLQLLADQRRCITAYALTVLLCDDYMATTHRFFKIAAALPQELQMYLCCRRIITSDVVEPYFREILSA